MVLRNCGHTFEYNAITAWLENKDTCPVCRSEVTGSPVINYAIQQICEEKREALSPEPTQQSIFVPTFLYGAARESNVRLVRQGYRDAVMWKYYKQLVGFVSQRCSVDEVQAVVFGSVPLYYATENPVLIRSLTRTCEEDGKWTTVSKFLLPRAQDIDFRVPDREHANRLVDIITTSFGGGFYSWKTFHRRGYLPGEHIILRGSPVLPSATHLRHLCIDVVISDMVIPSFFHESFSIDCTQKILRPTISSRIASLWTNGRGSVAELCNLPHYGREHTLERTIIHTNQDGIAIPLVLSLSTFLRICPSVDLPCYTKVWTDEFECTDEIIRDVFLDWDVKTQDDFIERRCYLAYVERNCLKRWKKILLEGYRIETKEGQHLPIQLDVHSELYIVCTCGYSSGELRVLSFQFQIDSMRLLCPQCDEMLVYVRLAESQG